MTTPPEVHWAESLAWRFARWVLGLYAALFAVGVVGGLSAIMETRLIGFEGLLLAAAAVGVSLNAIVWVLALVVLVGDRSIARRRRRRWMVALVVGNLLASLVFILRRRARRT